MEIHYGNSHITVFDGPDWHTVDGETLFSLLMDGGCHVWKLGWKHYLHIGNSVIDTDNYNDLWGALSTYMVYTSEELVPRRALVALQKLCRKHSPRFEELLFPTLTSQDFRAYRKIRHDIPKRKAYFESWVRKYIYPQS